jgi:hypothetical protein
MYVHRPWRAISSPDMMARITNSTMSAPLGERLFRHVVEIVDLRIREPVVQSVAR